MSVPRSVVKMKGNVSLNSSYLRLKATCRSCLKVMGAKGEGRLRSTVVAIGGRLESTGVVMRGGLGSSGVVIGGGLESSGVVIGGGRLGSSGVLLKGKGVHLMNKYKTYPDQSFEE